MSETSPISPFAPPDPSLSFGSMLSEATTNYQRGITRAGVIAHVPKEWIQSGIENTDITVPNENRYTRLGAVATADMDTVPNSNRALFATEKSDDRIVQHEFTVGNIGYSVDGRVALDSRTGYVISSSNEAGEVKRFFVYRSNSEGSWRASQGIENFNGKQRYLKGAEYIAPNTQYTQDTQLHPDFENNLHKIVAEDSHLQHIDPASLLLDDERSRSAAYQFGEKVVVYRMGSEELHRDLSLLPAGELTLAKARQSLSIPEQESNSEVQTMVMQQIGAINARLATEGLIPDFTQQPVHQEITEHPLLGNVKKETYTQTTSNGVVYEWVMSSLVSDPHKVWIDRVRLATAEANEYGVDKQKIFSGLLTSKLIEYGSQVTAIPNRYVSPVKGSSMYVDVSAFLRQLAPIASYVASKKQPVATTGR